MGERGGTFHSFILYLGKCQATKKGRTVGGRGLRDHLDREKVLLFFPATPPLNYAFASAAGRLVELRGTGAVPKLPPLISITTLARSLALPPSLSRFIFIILEFPLLSDRRRHAVPFPSFLHCFPSRDDARCGGGAVGGAPSSILLPFLPFLP